jgi:hypothetical protein
MTNSRARLAAHIIFINTIIVFVAILLHETGHIAAADISGCTGSMISVSNPMNLELPGIFVTLACQAPVAQGIELLLGLSGFLFIIPITIALFIVFRKSAERNIAAILLGFSIILSGLDLLILTSTTAATIISLVVGIALMCLGEVCLASGHSDYHSHRRHAKRAANSVSK